MYKELIKNMSQDIEWVKIDEPASEEKIEEAQTKLGIKFPDELKALYRELASDNWLISSIDNALESMEIWGVFSDDYLEEGRLLFFADNGCGDHYCYIFDEDGNTDPTMIYKWDHECDPDEEATTVVAHSIEELIKRYYNDEI